MITVIRWRGLPLALPGRVFAAGQRRRPRSRRNAGRERVFRVSGQAQGLLGGVLFRLRFFPAGTMGQRLTVGQHRHGKPGLVRGAIHGNHLVTGGRRAIGLQGFLEQGFGVLRPAAPAAIVGQFRRQGAQDELAGRRVALVQVNRGHYRFKGFLQNGIPVLPARLRLSPAQQEVVAQGQPPGNPGQAGAANQRGSGLGQFPLRGLRQPLIKLGRNRQFQDCVPQKLKPFIGTEGCSARFVKERAMEQRLPQQPLVPEIHLQNRFQHFQRQSENRAAPVTPGRAARAAKGA